MTLGRPKDFKCSPESVERMRKARIAYWSSAAGLAHSKKLSEQMKARWAEQKKNGVEA